MKTNFDTENYSLWGKKTTLNRVRYFELRKKVLKPVGNRTKKSNWDDPDTERRFLLKRTHLSGNIKAELDASKSDKERERG